MDLRLPEAQPTEEERRAVDAVLGPPKEILVEEQVVRGGVSEIEGKRNLLLPALHGVQDQIGWVSEGALGYICRRLTVPPAEAYGVLTFYALLATQSRPKRVAHVCDDIACKLVGADELCQELAHENAVHRSPCLGQCERGPAVLFQCAGEDDWTLVHATEGGVREGLAGKRREMPRPPVYGRRLLRRIGICDPESLDDYREHGGYQALRRAIELGPSGVLREVKDSRFLGRGGAAFPAGVKWEAVAKAPVRPHYVICNADESEPGTYKDRIVMEEDPFAVVEAMTIAGYAVGAAKGFVYIRAEYPHAAARLRNAIEKARMRGFLGEDVMGEGVSFDVELRRGAGAYICGEETALFNSIEGYRGEPRNKPPFPTEVGLFGKPTLVNNVETLVNVLDIVLEGGPAFATRGTEGSTGPKLFCVSGHVPKPGLYEVEFGVTLRELIEQAGGVAGGRKLRAVLLGGAAGSFVGPDELDVPLTFEGARSIGAAIGSGVVMVFDDGAPMPEILRRIAAFFRDESCGQCVPCRVGTVRQEEALHRYIANVANGSAEREVALMEELAQVMRDASICGLGHTAASAVLSALKRGLLDETP
ncbi:MAG TPA: NADH-ubiquinone oxidoreductase-F iron-sulfur binding region domain-containing protein [Vicinamibacteria bacterium]|nr:NADH-ubiquinone oxidoreductase-F iron-sulfur binding region domain-containing protein [Vicinamibacteria bacterium]